MTGGIEHEGILWSIITLSSKQKCWEAVRYRETIVEIADSNRGRGENLREQRDVQMAAEHICWHTRP